MENTGVSKGSKKRKAHGRMTDVMKKINLSSHEVGDNCNCRLKCFEVVPDEVKKLIINAFNLMISSDEQDSYFSGLITVLPVSRRRSRKSEEEASKHEATFKYRVRGRINDDTKEYDVCKKAFVSLHGVGKRRIERITTALKNTGFSPKNVRGKHNNRPHKIIEEVLDLIRIHIKSFPSRNSHYGLKDTKKVYLDQNLNVTKMHRLFQNKNPGLKVSFDKYNDIFNNEFNIGFGYPRVDTCSTCDELNSKVRSLQVEISNCSDAKQKEDLDKSLGKIKNYNALHKRKADAFYNRKKVVAAICKKDSQEEAICIDFGRNLPIPNVSTNDVYYRRQLSLYVFNVSVLSTGESIFYLYTEAAGKKGSDDVCSLVHDFVYNHLSMDVKKLHIFCDACGGQNKNFTMFRFLHYLVHFEKRFKTVTVTYPVRGHSYLDCNRHMALLNPKAWLETQNDWKEHFQGARKMPKPFVVNSIEPINENDPTTKSIFMSWTKHLELFYAKRDFKVRPIREIMFYEENFDSVYYRNTYHGAWESAVVTKRNQLRNSSAEFTLPEASYNSPLPISAAKYKDLQHLSKFCGPEAQQIFKNLKHN